MESTPSVVANPVPSSSNRARESRRRKKKIKTEQLLHQQQLSLSSSSNNENISSQTSKKISWKSESTQQNYSKKLLQALRHVRVSSPATSRRGRAVREAADRVLAAAARGRSRWSRAMLTNRLRLKFMSKKHKRQKPQVTGPSRSPQRKPILRLKVKAKNLPAVQRKVKTLGKLVPGCRKEPLPVILEEATDYIPALEMQIRAMRDILSRLSAVGGGGDGSGSSSGQPENGSG